MVLRKLLGFCACVLFVGTASLAMAGIVDLDDSTAEMLGYAGTDALTLYCLPNGTGDAFDRAMDPAGGFSDATITLTLVDGNGAVIPDFPFEDLWLEGVPVTGGLHGLVACAGIGTSADANTDDFGQTTWSFALNAGGCSDGLCYVTVNGDHLASGVALHFVSPDLNADGAVDVLDVTEFSVDFYSGSYQVRSDFNADTFNDVLDVTILTTGMGANCP